jgi:hypothetical protein
MNLHSADAVRQLFQREKSMAFFSMLILHEFQDEVKPAAIKNSGALIAA